MSKRTQVNLQVDPSRKEVWDKSAEESNVSLSHFIRESVEDKIAGFSDDSPQSSQGGVTEQRITELQGQIKSLQSSIEGIEEDIGVVRSTLDEPSESVRQLMTEVVKCLPSKETVESDSIYDHLGEDNPTVDPQGIVLSGRPEDIAEHLDEMIISVDESLTRLQSETSLVSETVIDGQRRFYRRGR